MIDYLSLYESSLPPPLPGETGPADPEYSELKDAVLDAYCTWLILVGAATGLPDPDFNSHSGDLWIALEEARQYSLKCQAALNEYVLLRVSLRGQPSKSGG